jgi:hypothetical protein
MVATAWKDLYPESGYTKGMLEDIKLIESKIANAKMQQLIENAENAHNPIYSIPDRYGRHISLSSLKGKVIHTRLFRKRETVSLLDNRELYEIYKKYKGKGFEIYQVSFDSSRETWL